MTEYALYVESGPRRRKTMVHVIDLLGCVAQGPTTEDALEATPESIRAYQSFLVQHGEGIELAPSITTHVAQHITQGAWLGNGDPTPGFTPDFVPLTGDELALYLQRLGWIQAALLDCIQSLSPSQLLAAPESGGRTIYALLEHVAGTQSAYLRTTVGRVEGLLEAIKAVQQGPEDFQANLARLFQINNARLAAMTEKERTQAVQHGQVTWTARRALRRSLEHAWEHYQELSRRMEDRAEKS